MAIFIEVDTATPMVKLQQGTNPGTGTTQMIATTVWKGGKITFDTEQIVTYGKYFDEKKNPQSNSPGGYINGKVTVTVGTMAGFIFNGTVSQFETAAGL